MGTIIHHYTNIDVLALILKNRTLRFTRLDQMDDPEECNFVSNGVNLGQYTFVSCWTEVKELDMLLALDRDLSTMVEMTEDGGGSR